jgi:outer membrane immunogenic protein
MKKRIVGGAMLAACMAGPAVGADLPVEAPVYVERPPAVGLLNWTGFYFGANLGYARSPGSTDIDVCELAAAPCGNGTGVIGLPFLSLSENLSGVLGGVGAGANWQTGNAVFGIEGDIQGTSQSVSSSSTTIDVNGFINFTAPGTPVTASSSEKVTSTSTLRGRLGIASGRVLYYFTGGGAFWTWSSNVTVSGLGTANLSSFQSGGAIGGGAEIAIANNWTVKAEYLYLESTRFSNAPFFARPDVVINSRIRDNVFRVGINYMFFTGSVGCRPHDC